MRTSSQRKSITKGSKKNRTPKKGTIGKIAQVSKTISKETTKAKRVVEKEKNKEKNITNVKESSTRRGKSKNNLPVSVPAIEMQTSNRKKKNIERKKKSCDIISNDEFLAKKKVKIEHVSTIDVDKKMAKKESKSRKNTKKEAELPEEENKNNTFPLRKKNKISKNEEPQSAIANKDSKSKISKEKKSSSNKKNQSILFEEDELSKKNVKKENKKEKHSSNNNKEEEYGKNKKEMIDQSIHRSKDSMNILVKKIRSQAYMIDDDKDIYNNEKKNIKMTFEVTNRFAVLGCDWDNISSTDVFYLFESYYNFEKEKKKKFDYKKSKAVKRVTIYTSKYGEQKLKYEEEHGPLINFDLLKKRNPNKDAIYRENNFFDYLEDTEITKKSVKSPKNKKEVIKSKGNEKVEHTENILDLYKETDTEEENEKIRLYQIQRSRYYFALVECYSKEIVEFLYEELNDMDADFCINYLDLRIIDDACSLDDYKIKESCEKIPLNYKFYYCVTSPLKHTCAKVLWDENPKRRKMLSTKFSEEELRELDWKEYLGSSSDDEEDNEMEDQGKNKSVKKSANSKMSKIQQYRNLLLGDLLVEDTPIGEDGSEHINNKLEEESMAQEHISNTVADDEEISETSSVQEDGIEDSLEDNMKNKKIKSKKNKKEDHIDSDDSKIKEVNDVFKNILTPKEAPKEKKSSWENYLDKVKTKKKMKKKAYLEEMKKKDEEIKSIISKKTQKSKKEKELKKVKKDKKQEMEDYKALLNDDNMVDERFVDLYKNKDFNLDITNPQFKRTKFNEQILKNKL